MTHRASCRPSARITRAPSRFGLGIAPTAALRGALLLVLIAGSLAFSVAPACAFELWSDEAGERSHALTVAAKWTTLMTHAPEDPVLYDSEWSAASLTRVRLSLDSRPASWARLDVAYDVRARIETGDGGGIIALPSTLPAPYRIEQLDDDLIDPENGLSARHELDRASVKLLLGRGNVTVGRQAVGWGRGLLFSVVDIFAPFSPLESDREWRRGVDALRIRAPITDLISLDAVGAFGESTEESAFIARLMGYAGGIDGELVGGRRRDDDLVALSLSMPLWDAEVHGELGVFSEAGTSSGGRGTGAVTRPTETAIAQRSAGEDGDAVVKALLGASRTFDILDGVYAVAEYHYSGYGVADVTDVNEVLDPTFLDRYLAGDTQILGRHAVAAQHGGGVAPPRRPPVARRFPDRTARALRQGSPAPAPPRSGSTRPRRRRTRA